MHYYSMSTLSWRDHKCGKKRNALGETETNSGHMTVVAQTRENVDAHSKNGAGLRCALLP